MKTFFVKENSTLKEFTDNTYPQGSFAFNALIKRGDVRVNGEKKRADCKVNVGDEVVYYTTPTQEAKPSHSIIYEDENIYVADKFSGVTSEALFCELEEKGISYPVHRLDRNTSGLIVIAKTERAQKELIEAFKSRSVEKVYLCLAKNAFKKKADSLSAYLKKDSSSGKVRIYPTAKECGAKILTDYEVIQSFGDYALVKVILHTGKTHQIRAHLAYIGCPVLGDTKYGDFALNKKYSATRQILIAKYLKFSLSSNLSYLNSLSFESKFSPELPKKGNA